MIIPLVGYFITCAIFACIGAAVLTLIPHTKATLANVILFVFGAVPGADMSAVAYGYVFGDATGELHSGAVLGLFCVLVVSGMCGGLLTVFAYRWFARAVGLRRESGNPVHR